MTRAATLISEEAQATAALERFLASDRTLTFDTETTGLQVRSLYGDHGRTIQFSWRPWTEAVVFELTPRWSKFISGFFHEAENIIAHNLKFDAHVVETYFASGWWDGQDGRRPSDGSLWRGRRPETLHDTVWVARLHDERDKAALKPLAVKYLAADSADEQSALKRLMTKNGWTWATVPIDILIDYAGLDAILTGRLFDTLYPRIGYASDAYLREQRLAPVLYRMERTGLLVDTTLLEDVAADESEAVEAAREDAQRLVPGININSTPQLLGAFRTRGTPVEDTAAPTLKRLFYETGDALAEAVLRYRKHAKTLGTYVRPWLGLVTPEERLHPSFNSLGAATGRMSSDNPNFQNITRGHLLRDAFVAAPGHRMVVADWRQMELRLYAHFAKDSTMRTAFVLDEDIYQQAADLLGVPRQVGKMMMLASIYGAGPQTVRRQAMTMAYAYGQEELIPALQAYDWTLLHERFHQAYSIRDLATLTELAARRRGMLGEPYITTLGGRRQRPKPILLPAVNGYRQKVYTYKDLGNSLVQGSSADLMKEALIEVSDAGLGAYLRLTVHDEMVLEVPENEVEEVKATVSGAMTRYEFTPALTVSTSDGARYGEAK